MEKGLQEVFSGTNAKWSSPQGGCYTWFEMTDGKNLSEIRDEVFNRELDISQEICLHQMEMVRIWLDYVLHLNLLKKIMKEL